MTDKTNEKLPNTEDTRTVPIARYDEVVARHEALKAELEETRQRYNIAAEVPYSQVVQHVTAAQNADVVGLEARIAKANRNAAVLGVAARHGLTLEAAARLKGETVEQLEQDLFSIAGFIQTRPQAPNIDATAGSPERQPKPKGWFNMTVREKQQAMSEMRARASYDTMKLQDRD